MTAPTIDRPAFRALVAHVFLLPNFPDLNDERTFVHELGELLKYALKASLNLFPDDCHTLLLQAFESINNFLKARDCSGEIDATNLIQLMQACHKGAIIPLHVSHQNAGVLIRWDRNHRTIEAFQLSPQVQAVASTTGRLKRKFPEIRVKIPENIAADEEFLEVLAESLEEMDAVELHGLKPTRSVSKKIIQDKYDATLPIHVFDPLFGFLFAHGSATDGSSVVKHTRDIALSNDIDSNTIRRSPVWLLFRVTLQQALCSPDDPNNHSLYKNFMLFFLALILDVACKHEMDDEILFFMSRKIGYRTVKLKGTKSGPWMESVARAVERANAILNTRLSLAVQSDEARKIGNMPLFVSDISKCYVKCPAVQEFLHKANQSDMPKAAAAVADPKSQIIIWPKHQLPNLNQLGNETSADDVFNLVMFEHWVEDHLCEYIEVHKGSLSTCEDIKNVAYAYRKRASTVYNGIPDHLSVMHLTLLDLWIACDQSAVFRTPLLLEYQPFGIQDINWGAHLLLRTQAEQKRLSRAETYIDFRSSDRLNMISNYATPDCFAARFAQTSKTHSTLMDEIKRDTEKEKQKKSDELNEMKMRQREYFKAHDESNCTPTSCRIATADVSCPRCLRLSLARDMTITPYQELLPEDDAAHTVVFELQVPGHIGAWREFCLTFLVDVAGYQNDASQSSFYTYLKSQGRFASYLRSSGSENTSRIHVASQVNSRPMQPIPVKQDTELWNICVPTSMRWRLFDATETKYIKEFIETDKIREECTMRLDDADHVLQQFLYQRYQKSGNHSDEQFDVSSDDPDESPDDESSDEASEWPANQNDLICKRDLTRSTTMIKHNEELGSFRFAERVIWPKVLRELQGASITWTASEASIFISQVALEAGCRTENGPSRARHAQLNDAPFAKNILQELARHLKLYEVNFSEHIGLAVISTIAIKVLVESKVSCHAEALEILGMSRKTCFTMLKRIRDANDSTTEMAEIQLNLALICAYTFNVGNAFLKQLLVNTETAEQYVFSSIVIQEGSTKVVSQFQKSLYTPWQRLAATASRILVGQVVNQKPAGIANGIFFSLGSQGKYTPDQDRFCHLSGSWIKAYTKPVGAAPQTLHFNSITAEVLVDGKAPSFLPSGFLENEDFRALFGEVCPAVLPSRDPRYQYDFRLPINGASIAVGLEKANDEGNTQFGTYDLHVRATKEGRTFILVPRRILSGKNFPFPSELLAHYSHWHHLGEEPYQIEFRHLAPWNSRSSAWYLCTDQGSWAVSNQQGKQIMVPKTCEYYSRFSEILEYFRTDDDLTVIMDREDQTLKAHLGSLALDFFVRQGSSLIRSVQYENMCIQTDYSLQTLIGLRSKLILSQCDNGKRRILIAPDGREDYDREDQATGIKFSIEINKGTRVQEYVIDEVLGQLKGNGTWRNKVYLAYLHALTSQCLPDPFTSNTGQETALNILQSAAVMSFESLDPIDFDLLRAISQLSAERDRPPVRQGGWRAPTVTWRTNLRVSSHHEGYWNAVDAIVSRAEELHVFTPASLFVRPITPKPLSNLLRKTDATRYACFRTEGYGAESHAANGDEWYCFRRPEVKGKRANTNNRKKREENMKFEESPGFNQAFLASAGLNDGQRFFRDPVPSAEEISQYVIKQGVIKAATEHLNAENFKYSGDWTNKEKITLEVDFCSIHRALKATTTPLNKFRLRLWLSTVASGMENDAFKLVIPVISAIIIVASDISIPRVTSRYMHRGWSRSIPQIIEALTSATVPFRDKGHFLNESKAEKERSAFCNNQKQVISQLAGLIATNGQISLAKYHDCLDVDLATNAIKDLFHMWRTNEHWQEYFNGLSNMVSTMLVWKVQSPALSHLLPPPTTVRQVGYIAMETIFKQPIHKFAQDDNWRSKYIKPLSAFLQTQKHELQPTLLSLTAALRECATKPHERDYVEGLDDSVGALKKCNFTTWKPLDKALFQTVVNGYKADIENRLRVRLEAAATAASQFADGNSSVFSVIKHSGAMPRLSLKTLLQQLSFGPRKNLSKDWLDCLQQIAVLCRDQQHMTRILNVINSEDELLNELRTIKRYALDTSLFPDAVLLEIEQDLCLRSNQVEIAKQMRQPPNKANAVMQLNMGEGKSSVIIPILSASLARGKKLVRVFVGKHQSQQMIDTMITAMGGLMNRRIFYMPFSRELKLKPREIQQLSSTLHRCAAVGGILLLQPEHHLSLTLSTYLNEDTAQTKHLAGISKYLQQNCRDIIDEIDENLSPTYELVYTIGSQVAIDFAPDRWVFIQALLDLYSSSSDPKNAKTKMDQVQCLRGNRGPDAYPEIRFLAPEMPCTTIKNMARRFRHQTIPGLPIASFSAAVKGAIYQFITKKEPKTESVKTIQGLNQSAQSALALVRGFIVGDLLLVGFSRKRWRVDYGCDFDRIPATRLAVPFAAKDVPKPRSEFSNADVVILFTQLSYYYGGLREEDARELMELMFRADDGRTVYPTWFGVNSNMSVPLRRLQGVNLLDKRQFDKEFYPNIKFSKKAIDHFLGHIVFPKELRAYRQHIAASGWDLGEQKSNPTTGFSGTTDLCAVLPLDMILGVVPSQAHTNALVLNHVLGPRNTVVSLHSKLKTRASDGDTMIKEIIADSDIRVILDVGAQIITRTNEEVAKYWLNVRKDDATIEAVVFFNASGRLSVMDRSKRVMPLKASIFAKRLDACVLFLDEAHTRGTDLRLPRDYRAAVTLGAGLTKDRLMQACMRMRNLGQGQTLTFYVSFEIESDIRQRLQLGMEPITTESIIRWSINQTTNSLTRLMPYWAKQGRRHKEQSKPRAAILNIQRPTASRFEGIEKNFVREGINSV